MKSSKKSKSHEVSIDEDAIDRLAHGLRHDVCDIEYLLREFTKEIRKCPYAGLYGSKCKEIVEVIDANSRNHTT